MTRYFLAALVVLPLAASDPGRAAAHEHCWGRHHDCPGCVTSRDGAGVVAGDYDPDTVTSVRGTLRAVSVVPARRGRWGGTHLTVESEGNAMQVILGPTWFLEQHGVALTEGDVVEVRGSVIDLEDATVVVARDLKVGRSVLRLRDGGGVPLWGAGPRRRSEPDSSRP